MKKTISIKKVISEHKQLINKIDMEEKIKKLKRLAIAHEAALNFDYCPASSEADYIIENIFDCDLENLKSILDEYEGYSPSDIQNHVFSIIGTL